MGPGKWGTGRGEWPRPPLAPGSRPSPGSQSEPCSPAATTPPPPAAALAGAGQAPRFPARCSHPPTPPPAHLTPLPRRLLPPQPALLPSPTSGVGGAGRPEQPQQAGSCSDAWNQLTLHCLRASSPRLAAPRCLPRVPGAEFTSSRSSPGAHSFGGFLKLHTQKATDLILVSYTPPHLNYTPIPSIGVKSNRDTYVLLVGLMNP